MIIFRFQSLLKVLFIILYGCEYMIEVYQNYQWCLFSGIGVMIYGLWRCGWILCLVILAVLCLLPCTSLLFFHCYVSASSLGSCHFQLLHYSFASKTAPFLCLKISSFSPLPNFLSLHILESHFFPICWAVSNIAYSWSHCWQSCSSLFWATLLSQACSFERKIGN